MIDALSLCGLWVIYAQAYTQEWKGKTIFPSLDNKNEQAFKKCILVTFTFMF